MGALTAGAHPWVVGERGTPQDRSGIPVGELLDRSGIPVGELLDRSGIPVGELLDRSGIPVGELLGSVWSHDNSQLGDGPRNLAAPSTSPVDQRDFPGSGTGPRPRATGQAATPIPIRPARLPPMILATSTRGIPSSSST